MGHRHNTRRDETGQIASPQVAAAPAKQPAAADLPGAADPATEPPWSAPVLVYLYGPPASGKLTVAERLAALSGYRLFHNHLTVNAVTSVFPFGSPAFTEVLGRVRLDVLGTAAREGISTIFTNNSAWSGAGGRLRFEAFAAAAKRVFEDRGGVVQFVRVTAPSAVLEERVGGDSRRAQGKLLDIARLRELLAELDERSLYPEDLVLDTSRVSAEEAARLVFDALPGGAQP